MTRFLVLAAALALANAKTFIFENRRGDTIWPASLGNPGKALINDGGWEMGPGSTMTVEVDDSWAGRVWARTGCNFDGAGQGTCETGDCGNGLRCAGSGGKPPVTLAEFTLNGDQGQDFYDVSNVDGFNLPLAIETTDVHGGGDQYRCNTAACTNNINDRCPQELQLNIDGRVVGCKSACLAFDTDQYCCRGACCDKPETCKSSDWPKDYPAFFKSECPDAYSYAYDDHKSTFTCANTGYKIIFS